MFMEYIFEGKKVQEQNMWLLKIGLFVSLFGLCESFAGPKDYGVKVYKHVIEVSDISLENPMPKPGPMEEEDMVARIYFKTQGPDSEE
jgi:hypothetical protein